MLYHPIVRAQLLHALSNWARYELAEVFPDHAYLVLWCLGEKL